jgi:hypothetical protein
MGEQPQARAVRVNDGDLTATAIGEAPRSAVVVGGEDDPAVASAARPSSSGNYEHDQTAKHKKEDPL